MGAITQTQLMQEKSQHAYTQQPLPQQSYGQQSYGQQPPYQQSTANGARTLHVYSDGMFSKGYTIKDGDKSTPLYNVQIHSFSKPQVQVFSSNGSHQVGSGRFHAFGSTIDMVVGGQTMEFKKNGAFSSGHQWQSPAMGGVQVKWKSDGAFTSDKICYVSEHKNNPIARWERASMSMSKAGKIHILDPSLAVPGSPGLDEIVVSAVIEMEVTRRRSNSSSAGGAAGAS